MKPTIHKRSATRPSRPYLYSLNILVVAVLVACAPLSTSRADYPVIESKVYGLPYAWIDNDTLLITVPIKNENAVHGDGNPYLGSKLVIWNLKRNTYEPRHEISSYCYDKGHVFYQQPSAEGLYIFYEGDFGAEKRLPIPEEKLRELNTRMPEGFDRLICRIRELPSGEWAYTKRYTYPLRPEHGLIDRGPVGKSWLPSLDAPPMRFVPVDGRPPVNLPINTSQVSHRPVYTAFDDTYLLVVDHEYEVQFQNWSPADKFAYFVFDPRLGVAKKIPASALPQAVSPNTFWRTRAGIVIKSDSMDARRETHLVGDAGLYLLDPNGVKKLEAGRIGASEKTLSPDGCRLAFTSNPMRDWRWRFHYADDVLKVINLCLEQH